MSKTEPRFDAGRAEIIHRDDMALNRGDVWVRASDPCRAMTDGALRLHHGPLPKAS